MDIDTLLPIVAFVGITTGMWGIWSIFNKRSSRAAERLEEWRDPFARQKRESIASGGSNNSVGAMFDKAAPALSKAFESKSELEQSNLKTRLANAGYSRPNASRNFLAIKAVGMGIGLFFGGGYGLLSSGITKDSLMSLVIGGGMGYYLPELVLEIGRAHV